MTVKLPPHYQVSAPPWVIRDYQELAACTDPYGKLTGRLTRGLEAIEAGVTISTALPCVLQKEMPPKPSITANADPSGCHIRLTMKVFGLLSVYFCDDHGTYMKTAFKNGCSCAVLPSIAHHLPADEAEQSGRERFETHTCQTRAAGAFAWVSKRVSHALLRPLETVAARYAEVEPVRPAVVTDLHTHQHLHRTLLNRPPCCSEDGLVQNDSVYISISL